MNEPTKSNALSVIALVITVIDTSTADIITVYIMDLLVYSMHTSSQLADCMMSIYKY